MSILLAEANAETGWLTGVLLEAARGGGEWILWILVLLSLASVAVFVERLIFLRRMATETEAIRTRIISGLAAGDVDSVVSALEGDPSMQARVVAYGLREAERGPDAVLELCRGAIGMEKLRYERGLSLLATVGSNAPFVGLFGTVMGVIMAFDQLRGLGDASADSSSAVMGAIAEALVATGVGLLVAIPAIVFYNLLKGRVKREVSTTSLLVETSVAYLRGENP
jgi:biopolymer transport protein ExbB/TolQ